MPDRRLVLTSTLTGPAAAGGTITDGGNATKVAGAPASYLKSAKTKGGAVSLVGGAKTGKGGAAGDASDFNPTVKSVMGDAENSLAKTQVSGTSHGC